ncbi:hypothetical protein D3C78_1556860 [compost metagenome]
MARVPVYTVIISNQLILNSSRLNKPAFHRIVDKRRFAAPAEWIAVLITFLRVEESPLAKHFHNVDIQLSILDEATCEVGHLSRITTGQINNIQHADAIVSCYAIIVLTMRRRDMDDTRTA